MAAVTITGREAENGDDSLFRKIYQYCNDAILIVDAGEDRIVDANPAACSQLDYVREDLLARPLSALWRHDPQRLAAFVEAVLERRHGALADCRWLTRDGAVLPVDISASTIDIDGRSCLLLLLHDLRQRKAEEHLLRTIDEGVAAVIGTEFFRALVRNLTEALKVRYSFVSEFTDVKTRVRTLAYWANDGFRDNVEYDLADTPCEGVLSGEIRHYPDAVDRLFPQDTVMVNKGIKGYLAIPLMDTRGEVLGHLAAFDDRPMPATPRDWSVFRIFAARTTSEMLRQQADHRRQAAEQALRESEERLASILASAMDTVIVFEEEHHIVLFNAAAEKIFHCSADWATRQPFDRFLSKPFRNLLERYLQALREKDSGQEQLWAPEGLTALRADGEEFPIEVTLSAVQAGRKRFYTVILRDINERARAEQTLRKLYQENRYLQEQLGVESGFADVIGNTQGMRELFDKLRSGAVQSATGHGGALTVLPFCCGRAALVPRVRPGDPLSSTNKSGLNGTKLA